VYHCHYQEKIRKDSAVFRMIASFGACYLLNPGGGLIYTKKEFGKLFKRSNFTGRVLNFLYQI